MSQMRKTPKEHPALVLQGANTKYSVLGNTIYLTNDGRKYSEDDCIKLLLHELDHWVQTMYVSDADMVRCLEVQRELADLGGTPIMEVANAFKTSGWEAREKKNKYLVPLIKKTNLY